MLTADDETVRGKQLLLIPVATPLLLSTGCISVTSTPASPETAPSTIPCGTFGTGGVATLHEANTTIGSKEDATDFLQAVQANDSSRMDNDTEYRCASRENVLDQARRDLRERRNSIFRSETLYSFSPDAGTDIDNMAVISEDGDIYVPYIGAC